MLKDRATSYGLSVCLLIAEYVRQHEEEEEDQDGTPTPSPLRQRKPRPLVVSKASLKALARFLIAELQHPHMVLSASTTAATNPNTATSITTTATSLSSLLHRLEFFVTNTGDFRIISSILVGVLVKLDSPDSVSNVVDRIAECVAPLNRMDAAGGDGTSAILARKSLLGIFVRKFLLAANRLLFDGLSRLYDQVVLYLEEFRREQEQEMNVNAVMLTPQTKKREGSFLWKESQQDDKLMLSPIPTTIIDTSGAISAPRKRAASLQEQQEDTMVWSHDQLNYLLNDMLHTIKRERTHNGNLSQENPLTSQLRRVASVTQSNPNVLFVQYMDFLNRRDYHSALDALHQYHDVTLSMTRQSQLLGANAGGNSLSNGVIPPAGSDSGSGNNNGGNAGLHFRGTGIQYSALNLAGLQIEFDHYQAAHGSIQEAIRVAQHHGDHICVAFALSWLIRINQKLGTSKAQVMTLIKSCLERSKELHLPALDVLVTLTQMESELTRDSGSDPLSLGPAASYVALTYASHVMTPRPLHIWARLQQSAQTITSMSAIASSSTANTGPAGRLNMNTQVNAQQANGNAAETGIGSGMNWVRSVEAILDTVWNLSGKLCVSAAVGWRLFGQRTLAQVFYQIHVLCYEDSASVCEIAITVCQMAMSFLSENYQQKEATSSNSYARALQFLVERIASTDTAVSIQLIHQASFQRSLHHLLAVWAIRRGEYARAEFHVEAVLALSPADRDLPVHLEALLSKATMLSEKGDYARSLRLLNTMERTCDERGFAYLHAQVLIWRSRVHYHAAFPHAPFTALNSVLKGAEICIKHQYDLLLAEAHVVIAEIYMAMGKFNDAYALMRDQMPLVMEHGNIHLRGECLLVLAKTILATREQPNGSDRHRAADDVIELLNNTSQFYAAAQDMKRLREVAYLKVLVYNDLQNRAEIDDSDRASLLEKREQYAKEFLHYEQVLNQAAFLSIEPFFNLESPQSITKLINHRSMEL